MFQLAIGILELIGKPIEALVKSISTCGARRLNVPVTITQRVQAQLVSNLRRVHCIREVLKVLHPLNLKPFSLIHFFPRRYSVFKFSLGEHAASCIQTRVAYTINIICLNNSQL